MTRGSSSQGIVEECHKTAYVWHSEQQRWAVAWGSAQHRQWAKGASHQLQRRIAETLIYLYSLRTLVIVGRLLEAVGECHVRVSKFHKTVWVAQNSAWDARPVVQDSVKESKSVGPDSAQERRQVAQDSWVMQGRSRDSGSVMRATTNCSLQYSYCSQILL